MVEKFHVAMVMIHPFRRTTFSFNMRLPFSETSDKTRGKSSLKLCEIKPWEFAMADVRPGRMSAEAKDL